MPRPDWGLNNSAEVVLRCYNFLDSWGILPDEGGLLDQNPDLMDDIMMIYWLKSFHKANMKRTAPEQLPNFSQMYSK